MQESLEGALQGQLRTALTKPMQDNFRTSFQELLLPSFEGACQSMFSQVRLANLLIAPYICPGHSPIYSSRIRVAYKGCLELSPVTFTNIAYHN